MQASGLTTFHSPQVGPGPNKAPDCIVLTLSGYPIAVEARELVSEEAIRVNQKAKSINDYVYKDWEPAEVLSEVAKILAEKDAKIYHGGPYWDIAVVIHTDEPTINSETYNAVLAGCHFGPFKQVTKAYFLFPYIAGSCSYVELKIVARRLRWQLWMARASCCLVAVFCR